MSDQIKFKWVFLYSLQVWLTSAFIGSLVFVWYMLEESDGLKFLGAYLNALAISLVFSLPSFLLLLPVVSLVGRKESRLLSKKLMVAAMALVLSVVAFLILFWLNGFTFASLLFATYTFYALPLLAAVFIFRFPRHPQPARSL